MGVEASLRHNFPKEGPVDRIICLMEVDFEEHHFEVSPFNFMEHLMEDEDSI